MNAISRRSIGMKARRNKFNACRTLVGDLVFHSKREAADWQYLKIRERAGEISDLRRQVKFELSAHSPNGPVKLCTYIADFVFFDHAKNREVVADSKGCITALFKLKAKLMLANHGIAVELL